MTYTFHPDTKLNDVLKHIGVETVRRYEGRELVAFLLYNGKEIMRPPAHKAEEVLREKFGITITYKKTK